MRKDTVRVNFEFPQEHYPYLKLLCAQRKQTIREFITGMLLHEMEEAEDMALAKMCHKRISSNDESDLVDWEEAKKLAGW